MPIPPKEWAFFIGCEAILHIRLLILCPETNNNPQKPKRMNTTHLHRELINQLIDEPTASTIAYVSPDTSVNTAISVSPAASTHLPTRWWTLYLECLYLSAIVLIYLLPIPVPMWLCTPLSLLLSTLLFVAIGKWLSRHPPRPRSRPNLVRALLQPTDAAVLEEKRRHVL